MDTKSTAAEGRFELKEKYRRWKETHLPAGDATATYPLDKQLEALGDKRLKAAHEAAMAGLIAEKFLAHIKPIGNFHYAAGLTTGLMYSRGLLKERGPNGLSLLSLRYMEDEANDHGLNHENTS